MPWLIFSLLLLLVLFLWWRITAFHRAARRRNEEILLLLDPIGERVAGGEPVSPEEVAGLVAIPHVRPHLHSLLRHFERLELFPEECRTREAEGASLLACWLSHPRALNAFPRRIEPVSVRERTVGEQQASVHLYRFLGPADDVWRLGAAGPFLPGEPPYESRATACSRLEPEGKADTEGLVELCMKRFRRRRGPADAR